MARARGVEPERDTTTRSKRTGRRKPAPRRDVVCYLCGHVFEVSAKTMSTSCPGCHRAIKIEDVVIKSYLPVNELQTCGSIHITKRGRVAAKLVSAGGDIKCEGIVEGAMTTPGELSFGPKATWAGAYLRGRRLTISPGASLEGVITIPWRAPPEEDA